MGLELTTGMYPPITSQTRYPLRLIDYVLSCKNKTKYKIDDISICILGYRIEFICLYTQQGYICINTLWL